MNHAFAGLASKREVLGGWPRDQADIGMRNEECEGNEQRGQAVNHVSKQASRGHLRLRWMECRQDGPTHDAAVIAAGHRKGH